MMELPLPALNRSPTLKGLSVGLLLLKTSLELRPQLKRSPTLKELPVGLPALLKTSAELRPQLNRSPTLMGVVEWGAGALYWWG